MNGRRKVSFSIKKYNDKVCYDAVDMNAFSKFCWDVSGSMMWILNT